MKNAGLIFLGAWLCLPVAVGEPIQHIEGGKYGVINSDYCGYEVIEVFPQDWLEIEVIDNPYNEAVSCDGVTGLKYRLECKDFTSAKGQKIRECIGSVGRNKTLMITSFESHRFVATLLDINYKVIVERVFRKQDQAHKVFREGEGRLLPIVEVRKR